MSVAQLMQMVEWGIEAAVELGGLCSQSEAKGEHQFVHYMTRSNTGRKWWDTNACFHNLLLKQWVHAGWSQAALHNNARLTCCCCCENDGQAQAAAVKNTCKETGGRRISNGKKDAVCRGGMQGGAAELSHFVQLGSGSWQFAHGGASALSAGPAVALFNGCFARRGWGCRVSRLATSTIAKPCSSSPAAVDHLQSPRQKPRTADAIKHIAKEKPAGDGAQRVGRTRRHRQGCRAAGRYAGDVSTDDQ